MCVVGQRGASSRQISTVGRSQKGLSDLSALLQRVETRLYSQLNEDLLPGSWRAPSKRHRAGSPG